VVKAGQKLECGLFVLATNSKEECQRVLKHQLRRNRGVVMLHYKGLEH